MDNLPAELVGLWKRRSLSVNGSPPFEDSDVYWLQGARAFIDVRVPMAAGQTMSFAGETDLVGSTIRFRHDIDMLALSLEDSAVIEWRDANTLIERGTIDLGGNMIAFEEIWQRQSGAAGSPTTWYCYVPGDDSVMGIAITLGDVFAIACDAREKSGAYQAALFLRQQDKWARVAWVSDGPDNGTLSLESAHPSMLPKPAPSCAWRPQ